MKYALLVRRVDESDISSELRFLPEDEEFEMRLSALLEELSMIPGVVDVTCEGWEYLITTRSTVSRSELEGLVRARFTEGFRSSLRMVSLREL